MQQPTDKQRQILNFIRKHIALTGQAPTVREIGLEVGLSSSCSVQKHLDTLEQIGKIRRGSFKFRGIEIVDENGEVSRLQAQPVLAPLLGIVAGGAPIEALQEGDPEMLPIPASLIGRGDRERQAAACSAGEFNEAPYFALEVSGESMKNAGIGDGDWVVARRQRTAENGDIVIALVNGGEATVKRFFKEGKSVRLQPENEAFEPLITRDVEVLGRVTLAIKRF
ncbi:MAG: transcriptional repressor LexA [Capsulimonadaceae bacterium]|nr:transcriptional repressor LexA [Capsulimonadaceae bacterium]